MKRPQVASTLRKLAQKRFPDDAYVNYYAGRYADYDEQDSSARVGELYERAIRTNQDNPVMLKEYIMWLDMVAKDSKKVSKLLEDRKAARPKPGRPLPLLLHSGVGAGALLCEASVSATQLGMEKFGSAMWSRAKTLAPLSECVRNNWPLAEPGRNYSDVYTPWVKFRMLFAGGLQHEVNSHNQPSARFLGDRPYLLNVYKINRSVTV
jgi:hypothetical protein